MKKTEHNIIERPPVIVIMGHIDHGKSTLLDYIRKTNVVEGEAGGITQRVSAYEVEHKNSAGKIKRITFLDTPGHEAFQQIRSRGAVAADIAVLVVSAEDGVKTQTLEALKCIKEEKLPYIVAVNKIDKPNADLNRTIQSLSENEIYIEGYGGDVPYVAISAKTGEGVPELLDMMLLVSEMEQLRGDPAKPAEGIVIESNVDSKKGISATLIIKDGTLETGMSVAAGDSFSPVRLLENFKGEKIKEAVFSSPVIIVGWNKIPKVGSAFKAFEKKKDAEEYSTAQTSAHIRKAPAKKSGAAVGEKENPESEKVLIPLVIKADTAGSIEAIEYEISKVETEKVRPEIISSSVGNINESDVKSAMSSAGSFLVGFNVKTDTSAKNLAERNSLGILVFDIIYKVKEWLEERIKEKTPKEEVEETKGIAKIARVFSKNKDKQIVGGKVESGSLLVGGNVKIKRRDAEIGTGKVRELQQQKVKASEVREGYEFGAMVESKTEIAPGDRIELFQIVQK